MFSQEQSNYRINIERAFCNPLLPLSYSSGIVFPTLVVQLESYFLKERSRSTVRLGTGSLKMKAKLPIPLELGSSYGALESVREGTRLLGTTLLLVCAESYSECLSANVLESNTALQGSSRDTTTSQAFSPRTPDTMKYYEICQHHQGPSPPR